MKLKDVVDCYDEISPYFSVALARNYLRKSFEWKILFTLKTLGLPMNFKLSNLILEFWLHPIFKPDTLYVLRKPLATSMLLTNVRKEICWWQVWDVTDLAVTYVGVLFLNTNFYHQHPNNSSTYTSPTVFQRFPNIKFIISNNLFFVKVSCPNHLTA